MESNLAYPYNPTPSPPLHKQLSFYAKDSDDLLFEKRPTITLVLQVNSRCIGANWTLARNTLVKPFLTGQGEPQVDNRFVITLPTDRLYPGFYDLRVKVDVGNGTTLDGTCVFGYRIKEMAIRETRPADFKAFWDKSVQGLSQIPLDAQLGPVQTFTGKEIDAYNIASAALPSDYDPQGHRSEVVEVQKVSFAGVNGLRVHGYLAKPPGPGPFPTMLVLPGAGVNKRPMPLEHARHGYLALDIQVHGDEVDLEKYPVHPGYYNDFVFEPINAFYYHRVYLHAVQAVNYLASRPDVNTNQIVAVGGSQGGRLSVVVAALDGRIKAIVPAIPHSGNLAYNKWAEDCNAWDPIKKVANLALARDGMDVDAPPATAETPESRCLPYYDIVNFAPDVRCPVLMNIGLIDPVSPPACAWPVFQRLSSPNKTFLPLPGLGHDWSSEFDRRAWRWLEQVLAQSK